MTLQFPRPVESLRVFVANIGRATLSRRDMASLYEAIDDRYLYHIPPRCLLLSPRMMMMIILTGLSTVITNVMNLSPFSVPRCTSADILLQSSESKFKIAPKMPY